MIPMRILVGAAWLCFWVGCCVAGSPSSLTPEQEGWLRKAKHFQRAGWIYLHIEGEPRQLGFQHGCLLAKEIGEGLRLTLGGSTVLLIGNSAADPAVTSTGNIQIHQSRCGK